jgi:hypothetical protein
MVFRFKWERLNQYDTIILFPKVYPLSSSAVGIVNEDKGYNCNKVTMLLYKHKHKYKYKQTKK